MTIPEYALLDCGEDRRLERFGGVTVDRPAPGARFSRTLPPKTWRDATLRFTREEGWHGTPPQEWRIRLGSAVLLLRPAAQGQIGVFPEHLRVCERLEAMLARHGSGKNGLRVLNLFAHTGLATIRLAHRPEVAQVTHVDAAAAAVKHARENAIASGLDETRVRWLVDDAMTFLRRQVRRKQLYHLILADPPAFGRDKKGGVWKFERDLPAFLDAAGTLLDGSDGIFCITCHREGWTAEKVISRIQNTTSHLHNYDAFTLDILPEAGGRSLQAGFAVLGTRAIIN